MSRAVAYCTLIGSFVLLMVVAASHPTALSNDNTFLGGFVTHELLGALSVIVSITLASAAQLHLSFNRAERAAGRRFLAKARAGVKQAAYFLIALFCIAICLVVIRPWFGDSDLAQAVVNGLALFVLIWNVLILISITQLTFAIGPDLPEQ